MTQPHVQESAGLLLDLVQEPPLSGEGCGELAELRAWASIGKAGICVHSFFAPRRGQPCAGCLLRESQRALGMLLDVLEHGTHSPMHGLEIESYDDAIQKARTLYTMVKKARSV